MNKKWMWKLFLLLILLALVVLTFLYLRPPENRIPTVSHGTLERFEEFKSQFIPARDIAVWLPDGYEMGEPCDVLYMHDGNMLFDATTTWNHQEWRVDEVMDSLIKADAIRRCIVVGIYNTKDRLNEYFPDKTWHHVADEHRQKTDTAEFHGDEYLRFIVEELKPFIDEHYKPLTSREHTFMMGSSMGGLISLYALCEYPHVFGGIACLSTHLSMAHLENGIDDEAWPAAFREYVALSLPEANDALIYLDHGTKDFDADYGPYQKLLDEAVVAKGWDPQHYMSRIYEGDGHNEVCWSNRLDQPLRFLLGK